MKLPVVVSIVGLAVSISTIGMLVYNAGQERERLRGALKHLCDQIVVLQKITLSEHPEYTLAMHWDTCE